MEATAKLNFVRISPSKVNQVLALIRRKNAQAALSILDFTIKGSARIIKKCVKSALANAGIKDNFDRFYIKEAYVGFGPTLKRFRAGSFGRASTIRKKTTHLTVVIGD